MTAPAFFRGKGAALLQNGARRLANLCYPRRCPLCGEVLPGGSLICASCRPEAERCAHNPPALPATEHCFYALSKASSAYYYTGPVRRAVTRCKLHGNPWLAAELADLMAVRIFGATLPPTRGTAATCDGPGTLSYADLVVPVPPNLGQKTRGYDLPALLAARLGKTLGIPLDAQLLQLTRVTRPQKELNQAERLKNRRGAYRVAPGGRADGKRILLVDDIITTGATVSACAEALLQGGAASVMAVSIAADEVLPKEQR